MAVRGKFNCIKLPSSWLLSSLGLALLPPEVGLVFSYAELYRKQGKPNDDRVPAPPHFNDTVNSCFGVARGFGWRQQS